jgi:predicted transcriptional regulator
MKKNNLVILSVMAVVIIALIITVIYFINKSKQKEAEIAEVAEMMNFEKQQVEREYQDLATEFDGYNTTNIRNDSLFKLLENQKVKVQQLLEELRVTKSTNARRITELKNELATVRKVMIRYVNQIDSLNAENKVLRNENTEVKRKYSEASQTVQQLSKEKENLNEVVTRASKLDMTGFSVQKLNNKNKKTGWFSQVANLQFSFTIAKNITAQTGPKTIYLRITRPDNEVLTKSDNNVFQFENKRITYSSKKDFEYTGEALTDVIYWKVEEVLPKGTFRADFFVDGNLIGSYNFDIK